MRRRPRKLPSQGRRFRVSYRGPVCQAAAAQRLVTNPLASVPEAAELRRVRRREERVRGARGVHAAEQPEPLCAESPQLYLQGPVPELAHEAEPGPLIVATLYEHHDAHRDAGRGDMGLENDVHVSDSQKMGVGIPMRNLPH